MGSVSHSFVVSNANGLHLRVAAVLARTAGRFEADIAMEYKRCRADAKSSLSILTLGAARGADVTVFAEGHDAEQAMTAIRTLLTTGPMGGDSSGGARKKAETGSSRGADGEAVLCSFPETESPATDLSRALVRGSHTGVLQR